MEVSGTTLEVIFVVLQPTARHVALMKLFVCSPGEKPAFL